MERGARHSPLRLAFQVYSALIGASSAAVCPSFVRKPVYLPQRHLPSHTSPSENVKLRCAFLLPSRGSLSRRATRRPATPPPPGPALASRYIKRCKRKVKWG
jgi:hypothetical protein